MSLSRTGRDEVLDPAVGDVDTLVRVSGYVSLRAQNRAAVESRVSARNRIRGVLRA
ncbi:hypothetical protein GCM10010287_40090 [Streptomyces variabilis]|uniref:Uncharacterized protein n=1 Tax=Streptomyces variabilis TaxID=67372 RepID=A0ABQ2U2D2_9ACTN|nr:hypothetical protein GCM10010265_49420 [Streptomyces griseoincarnatus]GGT61552.1 hypothetical protein GCM10010287_40090 [Streptomyces variabilis]